MGMRLDSGVSSNIPWTSSSDIENQVKEFFKQAFKSLILALIEASRELVGRSVNGEAVWM
jgi:hypothetical protein